MLSAPRSSRSAPSSRHWMHREIAASGARNMPPSLKESGVMLTMPQTRVRRPSSRVLVRSFQLEIGRLNVPWDASRQFETRMLETPLILWAPMREVALKPQFSPAKLPACFRCDPPSHLCWRSPLFRRLDLRRRTSRSCACPTCWSQGRACRADPGHSCRPRAEPRRLRHQRDYSRWPGDLRTE